MASPHQRTASKRSSRSDPGKPEPQIKRQLSEATEMAVQLESSLHLQTGTPHYRRSQKKRHGQRRGRKTSLRQQSRPKQDSPPVDQTREETFLDVCKTNVPEDEADGVVGAILMAGNEMKQYAHNLKEVFTHAAETVGHTIVGCVLSHQHSIDEVEDDHDVTTFDSLGNNVFVAHPTNRDSPCRLGMHICHHNEGRGYCIARVFQDSIADKACLLKSDILTHVNEMDIRNKSIEDVLQIFLRTSEKIQLRLLRQGKEGADMEITIELTIMGTGRITETVQA
ncbi:uncharacterized protein [Diadema antillarum]|uniref:uncharacterized protein n=1 Tax=Diadema antillarum TaxID=105358 RepID=UPI003A85233F